MGFFLALVCSVDGAKRRLMGGEGQGDPPGRRGGCGPRGCGCAVPWGTGRPSFPVSERHGAAQCPRLCAGPRGKEGREGRSAWAGRCSSAGEAAEVRTGPASFEMSWECPQIPTKGLTTLPASNWVPQEGASAQIRASRKGRRRYR